MIVAALEDGEIADDDNSENCISVQRNISVEALSADNITLISSTSMEEELEVDRIINEVQEVIASEHCSAPCQSLALLSDQKADHQMMRFCLSSVNEETDDWCASCAVIKQRSLEEARSRGDFTVVAPEIQMTENINSNEEENNLRLAAINSSRNRMSSKIVSLGVNEKEINESANFLKQQPNQTYAMATGQQTTKLNSSKCTWVPLQRKQSSVITEYGNVQTNIRNSNFHETVKPFMTTVRNKNVNTFPLWVPSDQQKMAESKNIVDALNTETKETKNPFEESLHQLRMCVEASKFSNKKENLVDNYEQVGMDIVDSDPDSRSHSSPASPLTNMLAITHTMQTHSHPNGDDNDEDVEQLRAALLEQVKKKKDIRNSLPLKNALEDGEISSPISEQETNNIGEGSSFSHAIEKQDSKRFENSMRQNRQSEVNRKRTMESSSSDSDIELLNSCKKFSRKNRESLHESSTKRSRDIAKHEFDSFWTDGRNVEEWERKVENQKKLLKEIEKKLRHRHVEKDIAKKKREKFLERADRCARELGVIEAEMEMLWGDQEKIKGRLLFLEREYEKAQFEESRREAEKKAAEREKRKKLVHLQEGNKGNNKFEVKEIEQACKSQMVFNMDSNPGVESVEEKVHSDMKQQDQGQSHLVTATDIAVSSERELSTCGMDVSFSNFPKHPECIELSDSGDSGHGPISAIHEMEQGELETDFIGVVQETIDSDAHQQQQQHFHLHRKVNRAQALNEKDINDLKNNPLIMFIGYRICSSFPYHLIAHQALSNKLDPLKMLCSYQLLGKCADATCRMQHENDYLMSDEELVCSVLAHCPNLCPPKKMFSEFAREILRDQRSKPVGEIIASLLDGVPENERRITVCEMAARCDLPSESNFQDDDHIEYELLTYSTKNCDKENVVLLSR